MDRMIVTVFGSEAAAYEGWCALEDLHRDLTITLYAMAMITKGTDGSVAVKQTTDQGPWRTVLGLTAGSLVGLFGGPVALAIGAGAGTLGGALLDLGRAGVGLDFVDEVSQHLEAGMTALVADVDEDSITPVDSRMAALGGKVFRRSRADMLDAEIEQDLTATEADLKQAEAELAQAARPLG